MIYSELQEAIEALDVDTIEKDRKEHLNILAGILQEELNKKGALNLNFICTHNSRRSHLAQVWAQVMSTQFSVPTNCYSGGTEATAVFYKVIDTLEGQGFKIEQQDNSKNPIYHIYFDDMSKPVVGFSKKYNHSYNPADNFIAIMTCAEADEGCPLITGATERFALTYEDPKKFDHTPMQSEKYLERSVQIATELKYIFNQLKG